jgi:hypothetical protein
MTACGHQTEALAVYSSSMSTCYTVGIAGYCAAMTLSSVGQIPVALLSVCAGAALAVALFIYHRRRVY